ncbi:zinc finger protein 37 homolog isoform X2 [Musca domestica]|nr:zinc finger protein 37 homolog isoform X2 [Musca domestica]
MTDDVEVDSSGFEECNHISEEQQEPTSQSKENSISVEEMQKSISGQILTKCHKEYEQLGANSKTSALEAYSKNTIPHESQNSVPENMEIDTARNVPAKILAISSDGTAVIEQKMKSHNGQNLKKSHVCEICGNAYGRRYELQAHIRRHHDVKAFECEICGQAFHSNFELSRHIRKHTGLRPYECKYCKRTFGDNSTLTKHERIHRNERPYTCKTCGKNFTYSSVLKVHQLTHTGEKPYNCELCGRRFSRSHHLRAHLETLFHSNDPKSKILIQRIKRIEGDAHIDGSLASINESV